MKQNAASLRNYRRITLPVIHSGGRSFIVALASLWLASCGNDPKMESLKFRLQTSEQSAADLDALLERTRKELQEANDARLKAEWETRKRTEAAIAEAQAMLASLQDNRAEAIKAEQDFDAIIKQLKEWDEKWAEERRLATAKLNELLDRLRGGPCGIITDYEQTLELVFREFAKLEFELSRLNHENRALKVKW